MNQTQNPFSLERDNKNFFLEMAKINLEISDEENNSDPIQAIKKSLNGSLHPNHQSRIKNMNRELQELAKKKQEILFKDSQLDYIFRKQKPTMGLEDFLDKNNDKKFRVRAILKQKKQTMHEFLNKKKEIFLSKMNINIKKQQTNKLEDYIKDQKQTLKARQLYYKNDVEFMNKFIAQIKKKAEDTQLYCQSQLKLQEALTAQLNAIQTQIERKQNLISKSKEDFENLNKYKTFLDKFLIYENSSWRRFVRKQEKKQGMFLTEKPQKPDLKQQKIVIKFSPQNLLDIFNQIQENNIGQIQNLHNTEQELQKVAATQKKLREQIVSMEKEYHQRIKVHQKSLQNHLRNNFRLKQINKNNKNKLKVTDQQDINLDKIGDEIIKIYREINPKYKGGQSKNCDSKQLKKCMTQIQHEMIRLWEKIKIEREANPSRNEEIEKDIKQNHKRQNLAKKQQQLAIQMQIKKQAEEYRKKNEIINEIYKGRKPMTKVLIEKPVKKKKVEIVTNKNNDQKYFRQQGDSQQQH